MLINASRILTGKLTYGKISIFEFNSTQIISLDVNILKYFNSIFNLVTLFPFNFTFLRKMQL